MSGMQLTDLPSQAFSDVTVTETFSLNNNAIKSIEVEAFFSVKAKNL